MQRQETRLVVEQGKAAAGSECRKALFNLCFTVFLCVYFGWSYAKYSNDAITCDHPLVQWCLGESIAFGILALMGLKSTISQWLLASNEDNLRDMKHQMDKLVESKDDRTKMKAVAHMAMARQSVKMAKLGLQVSASIWFFLVIWGIVGLVRHGNTCEGTTSDLKSLVFWNSLFDVIVGPCLTCCICAAATAVSVGDQMMDDISDEESGSAE
jgi:hypothetical protein